MTLRVSIRLIRDALKIEPSVGFLATRLDPGAPEGELTARLARPGSGMSDERLLPSAGEGDGWGLSGGFDDDKAVSKTSFKNPFLVEDRRDRCSSGTVSLFFSIKPSASYVTSRA